MGWMNQVGGLLNQYAGGQKTGNEAQDFDQVAQHAPKDMLSSGIASALRSDQTPGLGQVVSQVFGQAGSDQKAGILNTILSAVGPSLIPEILKQLNLGSLAGLLAGGHVTPQQAEQVPANAVGQMAEQAKAKDPNLEDKLGDMLSGHPDLVKSLGGSALSAVMSHLGK